MNLLARLKLTHAIIQAPMAGVQDAKLAIAVSAAGGLGSLPAAMLSPESLATQLAQLAGSGFPYNVNFFAHRSQASDASSQAAWRQALAPYYAELGLAASAPPSGPGRQPFDAAAAALVEHYRPAVVSFHFGLPDETLLARVRATGAVILSSATTVDEARWLAARGVDAVIAQGLEAGGHRGMFLSDDITTQVGTFALLPQIVAAVSCPVIAAGGIATPEGVRAALALGAEAVQIGTALLNSNEATTSTRHRAALASPAAVHTALTRLFSGRPARGIVNRLMRELGPMNPLAPAFPHATAALAPLRQAAENAGRDDFTPLWCGQHANCPQGPAAEITHWLAGIT